MLGRWTHSFEEDHDGISVYRRDDFAFPPARGRRGVEFRPDGTFVEWLIGRGDAPEPHLGEWEPSGVVARGTTGSALIVDIQPDRLELVWQD
ncbi:hypothetical protein EV643_109267 [Kribbella sp. VKM Ac-2527]|uniref:Uncharacterized protein n=1 Tax=Kribbella caucasensis TaxID=2512215 RepID=A0A4V3C9V1_9ACTN|nr:hypothetical protein [Kribbella sp. VKM Ac-2527]TDO47370.1 hypothetical protein EV643_109267 [Kribbella sp. VKM Ac-2527]